MRAIKVEQIASGVNYVFLRKWVRGEGRRRQQTLCCSHPAAQSTQDVYSHARTICKAVDLCYINASNKSPRANRPTDDWIRSRHKAKRWNLPLRVLSHNNKLWDAMIRGINSAASTQILIALWYGGYVGRVFLCVIALGAHSIAQTDQQECIIIRLSVNTVERNQHSLGFYKAERWQYFLFSFPLWPWVGGSKYKKVDF